MLRLSAVFLLLSTAAFAQSPAYDHPITPAERASWLVKETIGVKSLLGGLISAGFGTWTDAPHEYGTHWQGFGQRNGMRLTGVATGNAIEAGMGAVWGEDPRYRRVPNLPFKARVGHVMRMTFLAADRQGNVMPAYARYLAVSGNNFLSNTWRADSEADVKHAVIRTGTGFLGRMAGTAFHEFWPDVTQRISHRDH